MATMTHPSTMMPARRFHRASAATERQASVRVSDVSEMKGSLFYAIGVCVGILGVSLAAVLAPALGPPSEEAAALMQAKQVQAGAQEYLAMHPEDAIPTGDARAWGFFVPEAQNSSADGAMCPEYWVSPPSIC
ncbi:MAG: hypothetical protein HUU21_14970 [Polyangiaceae bacterium]|nr:hypothetical protein [Polyangiaceae bacterium]